MSLSTAGQSSSPPPSTASTKEFTRYTTHKVGCADESPWRRVSDEYLSFLRNRGVSYILAGTEEIALPLALQKLGKRFGVQTLLLEGGGRINGALLQAGLVDEVSLIVAPVTDGRLGTPALFDVEQHATPQHLTLKGVESQSDGLVWLRYEVVRTGAPIN